MVENIFTKYHLYRLKIASRIRSSYIFMYSVIASTVLYITYLLAALKVRSRNVFRFANYYRRVSHWWTLISSIEVLGTQQVWKDIRGGGIRGYPLVVQRYNSIVVIELLNVSVESSETKWLIVSIRKQAKKLVWRDDSKRNDHRCHRFINQGLIEYSEPWVRNYIFYILCFTNIHATFEKLYQCLIHKVYNYAETNFLSQR